MMRRLLILAAAAACVLALLGAGAARWLRPSPPRYRDAFARCIFGNEPAACREKAAEYRDRGDPYTAKLYERDAERIERNAADGGTP